MKRKAATLLRPLVRRRPCPAFVLARRGFEPRTRNSQGARQKETDPREVEKYKRMFDERQSGGPAEGQVPETTEQGTKSDKQRLIQELRRLRAEVLQCANDPEALVNIMRRHALTTTEMNVHTARVEAFRRCVWIIDRNLNARQKYRWKTSEHLHELVEYLSKYFLSVKFNLTLTDCVDAIWSLAIIGCRPIKLLEFLANKINSNLDSLRPSEFSDTTWAFSELRVDSVPIVAKIDDLMVKHTQETTQGDAAPQKGFSFFNFLPRDIAQLAVGYAQMDPAFHNYKVVWTLNKYLNTLGSHVRWQPNELLQLLRYDVAMRYINKHWELSLNGDMAKLCDEAFLTTEKPEEPYHDPLWQEIRQTLDVLTWSEWFYYKNIEGYHLPYSFWQWKGSPLLMEPQGRESFSQLDDGKTMLGHALLRYNSLDSIIGRIAVVPYHEWSPLEHQRVVLLRSVLAEAGMHHNVKLQTWNQMIDPHYHRMRYTGHRSV